jgi:predicted nucleic acid binding AN1-type Zn finger protein
MSTKDQSESECTKQPNTNTNTNTTTKPSSRCDYSECKNKRAAIIGDCSYCSMKYCSQHRLPELHKCDNLDVCCKKAQKENSDRLASQAISSVMKV